MCVAIFKGQFLLVDFPVTIVYVASYMDLSKSYYYYYY